MHNLESLTKEELLEYITKKEKENNEILNNMKEELKKVKKQKKYGLVWEEHEETSLSKTAIPLLKYRDDLSLIKDEQNLNHMLIEGDNYHTLKSLLFTHKGKIDVIYIDPPYNTGNKDFVYNDKFIDIEDGFRHSKWLSFMKQRLKLAHNLLRDDGVIFISIDDNEQSQLKLLCDSVFGENNFVNNLIVESNPGGNKEKYIETTKQFILVYSKNKLKLNPLGHNILLDSKNFKLKDSIGFYKKGSQLEKWGNDDTIYTHPNLGYSIYYNVNKQDVKILFDYNRDELIENRNIKLKYLEPNKELIENGYVCIRPRITNSDKNGRWRLEEKTFLKRFSENNFIFEIKEFDKCKIYEKERIKTHKFLKLKDIIKSDIGIQKNDLLDIFHEKIFDYPKPIKLIKYILNSFNNKNAIVLDFFAGSGTTGHAVMELNKEDGGNRQFILCTNNEVSDDKEIDYLIQKGFIQSKKEYKQFKETEEYRQFLNSEDYQLLGIARQVTRERLVRVINGYTTPKGEFVEGLEGNNLHYYQTDAFGDTSRTILDQEVFQLQKLIDDLLKVKHNTHQEIDVQKSFSLYGNGKEVLAILKSEKELNTFIENLNEQQDKEVVIYAFSWSDEDYQELLELLDSKLTISYRTEQIPKIVMDFYRKQNKSF